MPFTDDIKNKLHRAKKLKNSVILFRVFYIYNFIPLEKKINQLILNKTIDWKKQQTTLFHKQISRTAPKRFISSPIGSIINTVRQDFAVNNLPLITED